MNGQELRAITAEAKEAKGRLFFDKRQWMEKPPDILASLGAMSRPELRERENEILMSNNIDDDDEGTFYFRKRLQKQ